MNQSQRKQLAALIASAQRTADDIIGLCIDLEALSSEVDDMQTDEQEKFDNLSDGLQQSERGQGLEQAATELGELKDVLDEAAEAYDTLLDKLQQAAEFELTT